MRIVFVALSVILTLSVAGAVTAAEDGWQSEDLFKFRSVADAQISLDGARIAYTIVKRDGPGRPSSEIWVMDVATGKTGKVSGKGGASTPRWSPDGKRIAFLGREGDRSGLFVANADGGRRAFLAPVRGTNHPLPGAGERLSWSPDGKQIAYVSAVPGPETEEADGDPRVIRRYLYKPNYREGLTRFNDNRRVHIFLVDVATQQTRQLTSGNFYEHSISWSPDGKTVLFVSNRESDPDRFFNYDIFTVAVAEGTLRRVTHTETVEYQPAWSPDGTKIAYQGTRRGLTSSETTMEDTHIWVMDAEGSKRREVGKTIDNRQGAPGWSPDGRHLYFTVRERGSTHLYRLPVAGGQSEAVIADPGDVKAWSVDRDGNVFFAFATPADLAQLFRKTQSGTEQLTSLNTDVRVGQAVARVEAMTFLSFDGTEVEAFLTSPLVQAKEAKYPLIVMIKGGPHSQQGPAFNFKAQAYASRGWAVLMVNYRGSVGYGQAFTDAIFGDQNGGEAKDVLYGVQAALRRNLWLDAERVGIEGGSYGGQLTNWLITQTDRFRAAIPIASISNLISFNYMAYYHDYLAVEFGAFPHQGNLMDRLWERSALRYVAQVRTPTMLVHGENDNDVPIAEAEQFYIALKDVGVETIMVRYPREGHGVRETAHAVDLIDRSIAWYEKHFE